MNWNDGSDCESKLWKLQKQFKQLLDDFQGVVAWAYDYKRAALEADDRARVGQHWKDRVIDALVVTWAYKAAHEDDPKLAVNDLIISEIKMATDPVISLDQYRALKKAFEAGVEWINGNRPDNIEEGFEAYYQEIQK